jgi:hypothetical protein
MDLYDRIRDRIAGIVPAKDMKRHPGFIETRIKRAVQSHRKTAYGGFPYRHGRRGIKLNVSGVHRITVFRAQNC